MSINLTHNENLNHIPPYPQSKKDEYDRFIPNRHIMEQTRAHEAYRIERPNTPYQKMLYDVLLNGRNPNRPILALSSYTVTPVIPFAKVQYEETFCFEGSCSSYINNPLIWNGHDFITLAVNDCIYLINKVPKKSEHFKIEEEDVIHAFSWNLAGSHLAVSYNRDSLSVWDSNSKQNCEIRLGNGKVFANKVDWKTPDLIAVGYRKEFKLIDKRTSKAELLHFYFDNDLYSSFQFSQNEYQVLFATDTGKVNIVDIRNDKTISSKKVAGKKITYFERSSDSSSKMITASLDGNVRIFDLKSEKLKLVETLDTQKPILSLSSLQNNTYVTAHENGLIRSWDATSKKKIDESTLRNFRAFVPDPSRTRLAILADGEDQEFLSFYKFS